MTEGVVEDDKNASWRLRAWLRPGPVRSIWGRGLSERSEFRSPSKRDRGKGTPWGHARALMVLGSFAETKEPRRAGAKPRIPSLRRARAKPRLRCGSYNYSYREAVNASCCRPLCTLLTA